MPNTTYLDIATRALRMLGVIGAGQAPAGAVAGDARAHLQELIDGLPQLRNGPWTEVLLASDAPYAAADGERINTQGHPAPINLPLAWTDPETRQTAPPPDLSRVQIIGGPQAGLWLYAGAKGSWSRVDALQLSDDCAFGPEDEGGLAALLAVAMAPEFSDAGEVAPVVVERAARQMRSFRGRLRREAPPVVDEAVLRLSDTGQAGLLDGTGGF